MTYGVYSKDFHACSFSDGSLKVAMEYCRDDRVVCSEKVITIGFAVRIAIVKDWEWRVRPRWGFANLGFVRISWERLRYKWANEVVWEPHEEGGAE